MADVRTVCSGLDSDSKLIQRAVVVTGVKQPARKDNTASADGGCKMGLAFAGSVDMTVVLT